MSSTGADQSENGVRIRRHFQKNLNVSGHFDVFHFLKKLFWNTLKEWKIERAGNVPEKCANGPATWSVPHWPVRGGCGYRFHFGTFQVFQVIQFFLKLKKERN